jgi:ABC-type multidrug transport system fused ATPase/permease subunit
MIANIIVIVYFLYRGLSTSENIHESVIKSLLRASFTKFYNTVLIGRLINRLGKDITNIDYLFPNEMINFIFNIVSLLLPLVASIVYLNPIALPILIVFFIILILITIVYYRSLREVTRMEAISKSPIVSYF